MSFWKLFILFYFFKKGMKNVLISISLSHGWTCCLRKAMRVSMAMTIINCEFVMKASFFRAAQNIFFPIGFEIFVPYCRNGLPLIRRDMTGFWLRDHAVKGKLTHLFPAPIRHLCSEMPGACLFRKPVYCLKTSAPFFKKKKKPFTLIKKFY